MKLSQADADVIDYDRLLHEAVHELISANQAAHDNYGLGTFDRWDVDQETGLLVFSNTDRTPRVEAVVCYIGSFSLRSSTWLWGWANPSIREYLTRDLEAVRAYGRRRGLTDLIEPKLHCDEQYAWELSAFTFKILGGKGVYRGPTGSGYLFMLMKTLRGLDRN
jgi:hypothetical protein